MLTEEFAGETRLRNWIAEQVGGGRSVKGLTRLKGGMSTTLLRADLSDGSGCVLRLYDNREWLAMEPDLAEHEAASLMAAKGTGAAVPSLIAVEKEAGAADVPLLLMSLLPGVPVVPEQPEEWWLGELASALWRIHRMAVPEGFGWRYRTYFRPESVEVPEWTEYPEHWRKAIDLVKQGVPNTQPSFIHRDYHPLNVLWEGRRISGIVDWVNACIGPAQADIAHCRLNLVQMYGIDEADRFLDIYRELSGGTLDYPPYWDIAALMQMLPDKPEVYPGWPPFGLKHLTDEIIQGRDEHFLACALDRSTTKGRE